MKMALTVAMSVCRVRHCMVMIMQKGAQGFINYSEPSLLTWKKYDKAILKVVLSLPAVANLGN